MYFPAYSPAGTGGPVEEQVFWRRLEFRVCVEFGSFADRRMRHYWCDGLLPEEYDLAGDGMTGWLIPDPQAKTLRIKPPH